MQVVPEGVDEVDGVVSGIGIGVTWEKDYKENKRSGYVRIPQRRHEEILLSWLTKGDVSDVVSDSCVCVFEFQRRLPVAEQHLRGCVACSATLFELLHGNLNVTTFKKIQVAT